METPGKIQSRSAARLSGIALALAAGLLLRATPADASGLESYGIGPRGRAMGCAMVAVADDWTAIHYNPAGLVQVEGRVFSCGYELFTGDMESTASLRNLTFLEGPNPARGDFIDPIGDEPKTFNKNSIGATIHYGEFGYVAGGERFAFGMGLYGSGSGTGWEDTINAGADVVNAEISFINASVNAPLVFAYEASPALSFGLGLNIRYGLLTYKNNKYRTGATPYTMTSTQDTDGVGISADLGTLWKATDRFSVGAVLKLPYTFEKSGETTIDQTVPMPLTVSSDTTVEESYPVRIALGCAYRPDERNLLAFGLTWLNWSAYNQKIDYASEIPGVLEDWSGNPGNWHDAVVLNLGYERKLNDRWTFRCGLMYDEAPEPEEAKTLIGGRVLDSWVFTVGAGVALERAKIDFGYTHIYGPDASGYIPGAEYSASTHEFYVGIEKKF